LLVGSRKGLRLTVPTPLFFILAELKTSARHVAVDTRLKAERTTLAIEQMISLPTAPPMLARNVGSK